MLSRSLQQRPSSQLTFLNPILAGLLCQLFLLCCCVNVNRSFVLSFMVSQQSATVSTHLSEIMVFQRRRRRRRQEYKNDYRFKNNIGMPILFGVHRFIRSSSLPSITQSNSEGENENEIESISPTTSNAPAVSLTNEEIGRYSRHLVLSNVGMIGQLTLKQSAVLVIGAGGLGSPVLLYLAAAGVGYIGIVDGDIVDVSNLQRQIIHNIHTVNISKCQSAQQSILQLNPNVNVRIYEEEFTVQTAPRIITDGFASSIPWTIVIDGSDNFPTKYLIKYVLVSFI